MFCALLAFVQGGYYAHVSNPTYACACCRCAGAIKLTDGVKRRRFTLIGTCFTKAAAALDKAAKPEPEKMARHLKASMTAPDS
jgi:hypothetical protein